MNNKKTGKRKLLIACVVLLALALSMTLLYTHFAVRPEGNTETKGITFTVIHGDGTEKSFPLTTKQETLRGALEEAGLIAGEESQYGLFVKTVDGETADVSRQQWWCLTKDGQQHDLGVDSTIIADGERYAFTLTEGW